MDNTKIILKDLLSQLESLEKYDIHIEYSGCDCCGGWIETSMSFDGDWVKVEDVGKIIAKLKLLLDK